MKTYTIIAGVNGVGKSSLTGVLIGESRDLHDLGVIIDTDQITAALGGDRIKGGKQAVRLIDDSLKKGLSFTQETTLSGTKTLKTIMAAKERQYFIRLYYIGVGSADESVKRIKNRVEKGGHNIPETDVRRRYEKRFDDLAAVLPYCDEIKLYDNENGFVKKAEYKNQTLTLKGEPPEWLTELRDYLSARA